MVLISLNLGLSKVLKDFINDGLYKLSSFH